MKLQLLDEETCRLAGIDIETVCQTVQERVFLDELYKMKEKELDAVKKLVTKCIELDVEAVENEENTRGCFHLYDGKLIVVKKRKFDIKLLFLEAGNIPEFVFGGTEQRIYTVVKAVVELFINIMDGDAAIVFTILCEKYIREGRKYNNIEIYSRIYQFLKAEYDLEWSYKKINEVLLVLEHAGIIEWEDGVLQVRDKIYF